MISVAIMGHPARGHFIRELQAELPEAELRLDRELGRWDTGARAMEAHDPAATHHLVVQDDAILSRDLVAACEQIAEVCDYHPVSLYLGGSRPYAERVVPALQRARRYGATFIEGGGPWWGVGILFPVSQIPACLRWCHKRENIGNYDLRVGTWYRSQRIPCWYTVPSLVDHRPVSENPSLVHGRWANRQARYFIGADRSGTEIDWAAGKVGMDDKIRFRHLLTGRIATARPTSPHFARLAASDKWEQITEARLSELGDRVG